MVQNQIPPMGPSMNTSNDPLMANAAKYANRKRNSPAQCSCRRRRARQNALPTKQSHDSSASAQTAAPGTPIRASTVMCTLCGLRSEPSLSTWKPSSSARLMPNPLPVQKYWP